MVTAIVFSLKEANNVPLLLIIIILNILITLYVALMCCHKHITEQYYNVLLISGCKESHFYSLPFGQAEASIY